MEDLCFVGVLVLIVFVWIYDEISKQAKGSRNSSTSNKPVTRSKRGECRYCGAEVIVADFPDSISRGAYEDFGICEVCQMEIFMQNGGHF